MVRTHSSHKSMLLDEFLKSCFNNFGKEMIIRKRLFYIIVLAGLLLRVYFILTRDIFTDEVFYLNVALENSYSQLIQISHWIKDHGILYFLILKFLTLFSQDIIHLRFFNLIPYLLVNISLYRFFLSLNFKNLTLIPVALYSSLSYFVFMQAMVSPYNLVLAFATISILSLLKYILFRNNENLNLSSFSVFSVLSFYSDYSSVYLFLAYIPLFFWILLKEKEKTLKFLIALEVVLIGIIPGLALLFRQFEDIVFLNPHAGIYNLYNFADIMFLRSGSGISLLLFFLTLGGLIFIYKQSEKPVIKLLSFFCISMMAIGIGFVYLFSKMAFSVYVERSFWFFYLLQTLSLTTIAVYLKNKTAVGLFIVGLFLLVSIRFLDINSSGQVPDYHIHYKEFVSELEKEISQVDNPTVEFCDNGFRYVPLKEYYLKNKRINLLGGHDKAHCQETLIVKTTLKSYKLECQKHDCYFVEQ